MTRPSWLGRAARNRHRHAIEHVSRRWRGGRRDDSARTRRKILISTQVNAIGSRSVSSTVMASSSSSSRARAFSSVSPGSTLPPGNSQRPASCGGSERCWSSTRPDFARTPAATRRICLCGPDAAARAGRDRGDVVVLLAARGRLLGGVRAAQTMAVDRSIGFIISATNETPASASVRLSRRQGLETVPPV